MAQRMLAHRLKEQGVGAIGKMVDEEGNTNVASQCVEHST